MSNAYLVDVGVIVDKDEYPTCYSNVYDKARGYYDEDRYLVDNLEKAKKEALRYVADGVDVEDMEDYNVFVHSNKDSNDSGAPLAFASFCDDYPNREWTVFHI